MSANKYAQFGNDDVSNVANTASLDSVSGVMNYAGHNQPSVAPAAASATHRPRPQDLRATRWLKYLAVLQLACAVVMFSVGFTCFLSMVHASYSRSNGCHVGYAGWCGAFAAVAASIGVGATMRGWYKNRCLFVAYFVMTIIAVVLTSIEIVTSFVYLNTAIHRRSWYQHDDDSGARFQAAKVRGIAFNSALALVGLAYWCSSVVTLALTCSLWGTTGLCCGVDGGAQAVNAQPLVIYIQAPGAHSQAHGEEGGSQPQPQVVLLPAGAVSAGRHQVLVQHGGGGQTRTTGHH